MNLSSAVEGIISERTSNDNVSSKLLSIINMGIEEIIAIKDYAIIKL